MKDRFGRSVNYLRISVVDRCNLRCQFCMPINGLRFHSAEELLSFEEIVRVVQVANKLGIDRAQITQPHAPDRQRRDPSLLGLRHPCQAGSSHQEGRFQGAIEAGLQKAAQIKPAGHHWEEGQITQTIMSSLGG